MATSTLAKGRILPADQRRAPTAATVLVACPDARPPAYQAVVGLHQAGRLDRFLTAFYYRGSEPWAAAGRRLAPAWLARAERVLRRRHDPEIPGARVRGVWEFDAALALEGRLGAAGRRLGRWRTERFDRALTRELERRRPGSALIFSDVGSEFALPACRSLGINAVLSMVHGDVREERAVLERQAATAPDFFSIYLGSGSIDRAALDWLHARRLRDLEWADRVLVPSTHLAETLARFGTPRDRIRIVPYAADSRRFRPDPGKTFETTCTFLFAGGISQRKGIKYLLEAWRLVRRPGWRLQLLGPWPRDPGPLEPYRDEVEWLGRVGHAEMPAILASADVFVFPSLFEGSAVVTYEALACGLPSIVTAEAGSVVRDGIEGRIVPAADAESLALAMEELGRDPARRAALALAARARAEAFDWPRYHAAVNAAIEGRTDHQGGSDDAQDDRASG